MSTMQRAKDYFSKQSDFYAKYRPKYPAELFEFVANLCKEKNMAWDCATGNGQAASALAKYFKQVVATDISDNQLKNAFQKENITYKVERSEESSLPDESVDLVTVATAIHWFDIPAFYAQVDRVLKHNGVLAVWGYGGCSINGEMDNALDHFAFETLNDYWPKETWMNWKDKYQSLPFHYPLIDTPKFTATAEYTLDDLMNYMYSWSGVQQYIKKQGSNPIDLITSELHSTWGNPLEPKKIYWDIFMKCGIKE